MGLRPRAREARAWSSATNKKSSYEFYLALELNAKKIKQRPFETQWNFYSLRSDVSDPWIEVSAE